jgi:hypothetical protein
MPPLYPEWAFRCQASRRNLGFGSGVTQRGQEARMQGRQQIWIAGLAALVLTALMLAIPARAHVRVFVGGGYGVPIVTPYAYPYYPAPYAYPYYNYYTYTEPVPPPGFVPGHWEWRRDSYGGRIRVWVPAHLD